MRGFKRLRSADTVTRGHALVQTLRNGFSSLTAGVPVGRKKSIRGAMTQHMV